MIRSVCPLLFFAALLVPPSFAEDPAQNEIKETSRAMMQFYANASAEHFTKINSTLAKHQESIVQMGKRNRFDVLAATFLARAHQKFDYEISGDGPVIELARDIVAKNEENERAVFVNDNDDVTPSKLDVWWVSFFTTGETRYLEFLLAQTGDANVARGNPAAATIRRVANWSFRSNCKNHDLVRDFAAAAVEQDKWKEQKKFLEECLQAK